MPNLATIAGAVSLCIWLYLAFARGFFWRLPRPELPQSPESSSKLSVAAVIPARDEAAVIGSVVEALVNQQGMRLPVFLVDDGSTDGTAAAARETVARLGKSDQLTVIESEPLPSGWTGKLWAMRQGIERARALTPEWLLFADADVLQGPSTVSGLAAIADSGRYDLVSYMVRLHCSSAAEKLLIPAFVYFFFKLYPPSWIRDATNKTAGAAGGCVLVRTEALLQAGGVDAIRGEIIDDCSLARLIKQRGGRLWLGLTEECHSIREYQTFSSIERMVARTAFNQLNHSGVALFGTVLGMALTYLVPPLLLLSGALVPAALGAIACALMVLTYLGMVRYYRLGAPWALTLPIAALFYVAATVHSALKYWMGAGGEWKGRAQDVDPRNLRAAPEIHQSHSSS